MIGRDWTHVGVAKLYTDIVRNGYKIMYLTSRAIGQADATRDYLKGIKQNNYQLPEGPVIMSPDRLMASLHRCVSLHTHLHCADHISRAIEKSSCANRKSSKWHAYATFSDCSENQLEILFMQGLETESLMHCHTVALTFPVHGSSLSTVPGRLRWSYWNWQATNHR